MEEFSKLLKLFLTFDVILLVPNKIFNLFEFFKYKIGIYYTIIGIFGLIGYDKFDYLNLGSFSLKAGPGPLVSYFI